MYNYELTKIQSEVISKTMQALHMAEFENHKKIGIVSMVTGSGKTVCILQIAAEMIHEGKTVLLISDRAVLLDQYYETRKNLNLGIQQLYLPKTGFELHSLLDEKNIMILSTLQKLSFPQNKRYYDQSINPVYRDDIVIIVDEAQHSMFGRMMKGLLTLLPNAYYLAFTSFEIGYKAEPTTEIFGNVICQYSYSEAMENGQLLPIRYIRVNSVFDDVHSKNELAGEISSEFKEKIADQILEYFHEQPANGKAIVVNQTIIEAELLCEVLKKRLPSSAVCVLTSRMFPRHREKVINEFADTDSKVRILLVVSSLIGTISPPNLDTIFLLKKVSRIEMQSLIGKAARLYPGKTCVNLYDFVNNRIYDELKIASSIEEDVSLENNKRLLHTLCTCLAREDFTNAQSIFTELNEPLYQKLKKELSFLEKSTDTFWLTNMDATKMYGYLWNYFSTNSVFEPDIEVIDQVSKEQLQPELRQEMNDAKAQILNPYEKGKLLETDILKLLKIFFLIDDDTSDYILKSLRRQQGGMQNGFDIDFTYRNHASESVRCVMECKNKQTSITAEDILDKLEDCRQRAYQVEHWILISPCANVENKLNEYIKIWEYEGRWEPIKKVQFWTPDEAVEEFLGIESKIYDHYYPSKHNWEDHPRYWTEAHRNAVIAKWREKLKTVPLLPKAWKEYIRNPLYILLNNETDSLTREKYESLYGKHIEMKALDEAGMLKHQSMRQYLNEWLKGDCRCSLLLGDFGDGKTYFTYAYTRRLSEEYMQFPETGWLSIRFCLRDYKPGDTPQEFVERRLKAFNSNLRDWNDIRNKRVLVILDGFDEMSTCIGDKNINNNLKELVALYHFFAGMKVLITSRKHFLYHALNKEYLLERLDSPEIVQLASFSRKEATDYLEAVAEKAGVKRQMNQIKHTKDVVGLAAKPLFLQMVRDTMLSGRKISEWNTITLYESYISNCIDRKFEYQLESPELHLRVKTKQNLLHILEDLAWVIQESNGESISIEQFRQYTSEEQIDKLLWNLSNSDEDTLSDAKNCISIRSLLKLNSEQLEFCHRSMREYFVARGLARNLCSDGYEKAKEFLANHSLSTEIIYFSAEYIKETLSEKEKVFIAERLIYAVRHLISGQKCNSLDLLYQLLGELPGDSWNGLHLDYAHLPHADLSGKNFSHTSLRFAVMDNVNFRNADFSYADLTGVRLEETSPVTAIYTNPHDEYFYAEYEDKCIRRWNEINASDMQSYKLKANAQPATFIIPFSNGLIRMNNRICCMMEKGDDGLQPKAQFRVRAGMTPLELRDNMLLYKENGDDETELLYLADLKRSKILNYSQVPVKSTCSFLDSGAFIVYTEDIGATLVCRDRDPLVILDEKGITCLCVTSNTERHLRLAFGFRNGKIMLFDLFLEEEWHVKHHITIEGCHFYIKSVHILNHDEILVSDLCGNIFVMPIKPRIEKEEVRNYSLQLICSGMNIDQLKSDKEYSVLKGLIEPSESELLRQCKLREANALGGRPQNIS